MFELASLLQPNVSTALQVYGFLLFAINIQ